MGNWTRERFWRSVFAPVQQWFDQHPWLEWLLQHPLWLVGLILLVIFLFAGLIQAIGRLTENIWLTVLLLPFRLATGLFWGMVWGGRFLLGRRSSEGRSIAAGMTETMTETIPETIPEATPEHRLRELLDRLDAIRLEEEALLKEVKEIVAAKQGTD